jgi:hypothetical protein
MRVALFGPRTEGAMAPDLPVLYSSDQVDATAVHIPISAIQRSGNSSSANARL